jgi:RNA polymerase sigma-70 factor (ECF subfamily)
VAERSVSFEPELTGGCPAVLLETVAAPEGDERLLEGLQAGEESAYETLVERYQQPVYNLVYRLLRDSEDASDVVQDVFLKVFRKVGSFRGESSLRTWVYRIAVNEVHNHSRWNGRHRRQEVGLEGDDESRGYCDILPAASESPFAYALIVLRDIEDLSYEEIAEILLVPIGTIKSRILRGREALRRELEKRLEHKPEFQWMPKLVE